MRLKVIYSSLLIALCLYYPLHGGINTAKILRYACYVAAGGAITFIIWHAYQNRQRKMRAQSQAYYFMSNQITSHVSDGDYEQEILYYLQYPRNEIQGYEDDFDELTSEQKKLLFNAIQKQKAHKNFLKEISTIAGSDFRNNMLQSEYWTLIDNCSPFYTLKQSPQYLLEEFKRENSKATPSENLD